MLGTVLKPWHIVGKVTMQPIYKVVIYIYIMQMTTLIN